MPRRIFSVSYDEDLLATRGWLMERAGYEVTSARGLAEAVARCRNQTFDLFVLGHSIPAADKQLLIQVFHQACPSPVLSLRKMGDAIVAGADHHVFSDNPRVLLEIVESIFSTEAGREEKPPPKPPAQSYTVFSAESKSNKEKGDHRR